nr:hypothetical protein [Clostridia bacterium]
MKKLLAILASIAILVSAAIPASAAPTKSILVIGDSIATGYGLNGYKGARPGEAADSFGAKLAAEYGLTYGHTYYNFAVDGMTSEELESSVNAGTGWAMHKANAAYGTSEYQYSQYAVADSSAAQVALKSCDTVIISIGGNDLLRPMFEIIMEYIESNAALLKMMGIDLDSVAGADVSGLPSMLGGQQSAAMLTALTSILTSDSAKAKFTESASDFASNISLIADAIYGMNPDADVYFLCLYNPFDGVEMFAPISEMADGFITSLSDAVTAQASVLNKAGRSFTPVYVGEMFKGNALGLTNILAFDIHPNAAGHDVIYKALKAAIEAPKTGSGAQIFAPSTADMSVLLLGLASGAAMLGAVSAKRKAK